MAVIVVRHKLCYCQVLGYRAIGVSLLGVDESQRTVHDRIAGIQRQELLIHLSGRIPILGLYEASAFYQQILDLIHVRGGTPLFPLPELGQEALYCRLL